MCHLCVDRQRITETLQGATKAEMYGNEGIDPKDYFEHTMDAWSRLQGQELSDAIDQTLLDQMNSMTPQEWATLKEQGTWPKRFNNWPLKQQ